MKKLLFIPFLIVSIFLFAQPKGVTIIKETHPDSVEITRRTIIEVGKVYWREKDSAWSVSGWTFSDPHIKIKVAYNDQDKYMYFGYSLEEYLAYVNKEKTVGVWPKKH